MADGAFAQAAASSGSSYNSSTASGILFVFRAMRETDVCHPFAQHLDYDSTMMATHTP